MKTFRMTTLLFLGIGLTVFQTTFAADSDVLHAPMAADVARTRTFEWVAASGVNDRALLERIGNLWKFDEDEAAPTTADVFEKAMQSFALAEPKVAKLIELCKLQNAPLLPPEAQFALESESPFFRSNVGLFYARYLAHRQMYETSLTVFEKVDLSQTIDPASALFFQAVCQHRLLMRDDGLKTIDALTKNTEDVPLRYSSVAELMKHDLEALRENTLNEVARKMSDVERRLNLGRGGQKVQKREEEIIATLDEIIKKLEQQQGGGGGGGDGSGQNRNNQSGSPANDSGVKGNTAPGEVDSKRVGNQAGWGSLPPKKEATAKNLIDRNFPAHYRQAIEKYFKKLAGRSGQPGGRR